MKNKPEISAQDQPVVASAAPGRADSGGWVSMPRAVLIALACLVAVWLGRLLVLPLGDAAPLWPAAGVALAAALMQGARVWPAIWLGLFLGYLPFHAPGGDVVPEVLMAAGTTLQALLGAALTRSLFATPSALAREFCVARFLLLAGPLACLLAPTLGVITLLAYGRLAPADVVGQWLAWWAGDALGAMLIGPIALLAWRRGRQAWSGGPARVALPLVVTAALLALLHVILANLEENRAHDRLQHQMAAVADEGFSRLPERVEALRGVERFFAASEDVDKTEFAIYTARIARLDGMLSVDWAPRVPAAALAGFEGEARREHGGNYRVFELDADGDMVAAQARAEFFPVRFTEPMAGNVSALGLDHGFQAERRQAMARARASGEAVAADLVPLLRTPRHAMLVFVPAYAPEAGEARALAGFVVGVFDLDALFAPLARAAARAGFAFRVGDATPGAAARVLAGDLAGAEQPAWQRKIDFAGRVWHLEMRPLDPVWRLGATTEARFALVLSMLAAMALP